MTISKDVNLGNSFNAFAAQERVVELLEQITKNNRELINQLNKMSPEDYNHYLPKVKAVMGIKENEEIPTLARYENNERDDIPSDLYRTPGTVN